MHESVERLKRFEPGLHPEMAKDIERWKGTESLGRLHASLHAHGDERTFLNACAEALVARHLESHGCALRFEVPTPAGKRCDFEVVRDDLRFYLHVKRLSTGRPRHRRLPISSRLRLLERIERPYIVNIRWHEHLTDQQMQQLVRRGEQFILQSRIGDELTVRDERTKEELGGFRILAPSDRQHVSLVIGLPSGFIDESLRMRRLLTRAYQQFMPRALNVILLCSEHDDDAQDFEAALLGAHVERWDEFPPRGKRIAHGRADDGFWFNECHESSRAAGWFKFSLTDPTWRSQLWIRDADVGEDRLAELIESLFNARAGRSER